MPDEQLTGAEATKSDGNQPVDHNPNAEVNKKASAKKIGGRPGPDPTRYGDWEMNGRCVDF